MKFIYFNPETQMGYITEPLTDEEAEFIAKGIGIYVAMYIAAILITAVIILPFIIVSGLDKFLISFCSVNKNFIIWTAIGLILIRFFTVRLSSALIVRFLCALMIMVPVLYILLYKFHMANMTIIIGKHFELTKTFVENTAVQGVWLESLIQNIKAALSKVFFSLSNPAQSIDYSAFSSSLSTINIASILVCIGKTLFWWGLLILFSLLIFVVGLVVLVIIVEFPYFVAFGMLVLVNNLIYRVKLNYVRYLKF